MRKSFARHGAGGLRGARPWLGGLVLAVASLTAAAASSSAPFRVNLTLLPPFKDTPDCTTMRLGTTVSIACTTPGADLLSSPRYLLHVYRDGEVVQTVDTVADPGTVTSWRVVHASDRDFLEIVVGW
jgi:hypothetical protein